MPKKIIKPKLTNAQSRERAIEAHRLPAGTFGRQYQIALPEATIDWFLSLNSLQRGAIVKAGMIAIASQQENKE